MTTTKRNELSAEPWSSLAPETRLTSLHPSLSKSGRKSSVKKPFPNHFGYTLFIHIQKATALILWNVLNVFEIHLHKQSINYNNVFMHSEIDIGY